jgi:GNAT superfamily N-acetyltransferase
MTVAATFVRPAIEPVIVRPARPDEIGLVRLQWVRSYEHSYFGKLMRKDVYWKAWGRVIDLLLARSTVLCVCPEDSPEAVLYGWLCWEPEYRSDFETAAIPVLHYFYVRGSSRRLGYGAKLLAELPATFSASHCTPDFSRAVERWNQDRAAETGLCFGENCGAKLARVERDSEVRYRCERRPSPKRPACLVEFTRPVGFKPATHPNVTIDLTLV